MTPRKKKGGTQKEQPSFETLLNDLENTVAKLESGKLSLEESIGLFEKGTLLAQECRKKLDNAERKVEMLLFERGKEVRQPFLATEDGMTTNANGEEGASGDETE